MLSDISLKRAKPGICMQLITTKEPDESMIEVAIASLKAVLEEEPEEKKA